VKRNESAVDLNIVSEKPRIDASIHLTKEHIGKGKIFGKYYDVFLHFSCYTNKFGNIIQRESVCLVYKD